jgi:glycine cleavage system H protein
MRVIDGHEFPEGLWYHRAEHLWLRPAEPDARGTRLVTVGLDALGAQALGEVVYVQLVEAGLEVAAGQPLGSLEAEKMVRPVLAPVSGLVAEVNRELGASPRLLSTDPYGRGWLVRIATADWARQSSPLVTDEAEVTAWVKDALREYEEGR